MKKAILVFLALVAFTLQACDSTTPTATPRASGGKAALRPFSGSTKDAGDTGFKDNAPAPNNCGATSDNNMEKEVITLVNAERAKQNLQPLTEQSQLMAAARGHSADMGCNNFMSHDGSNGSTFDQRIGVQGYVSSASAENVAAGDATAQSVVQGWMNSEGHRANILNPDFTEIGVGHIAREGTDYTHYWTQVFGRP